MKIGLRGGHSPNCKGAMGLLDEQAEVRVIYGELVPLLQAHGHTVVDCNSNAPNVNAELREGTDKANANGCDVYLTIHMNASGGAGHGTECLLYSNSNETMNHMAAAICRNFAEKGFQNRGVKFRTGLHDLRASKMPGMIIETLFCDNEHDVGLYRQLGAKGIAELIANGVAGQAAPGGAPAPSAPAPTAPSGAGKDWVARLQAECNAQGYSRQAVDGIAGPNTLAGCPQLGRQSRGKITALMQEKLISLGFSCGPYGADGVNGGVTQEAIKAFQKSRGLKADGIVGRTTWKKLLGL